MLADLLPRRFAVRSGSILGRAGLTTRQLDLILCDLDNYPEFSYDADASLILPESVYGVISVKTELRPTDMDTYFVEASSVKTLMNDALDRPWPGFCAIFGYEVIGSDVALTEAYYDATFKSPKREGLDLAIALSRGPLCVNLATFVDPNVPAPPAFLASRTHVLGIAFDAARVDSEDPFADFVRLIHLALDPSRSDALTAREVVAAADIQAEGMRGDPRFIAVFAGKSADLVVHPGDQGSFTIFYANVGSATWSQRDGTAAVLGAAGPLGHLNPPWVASPRDDRFATQTQVDVAPGQIATFTFNIAVPADAPAGSYRIFFRPLVEGIGALTPETRAHAVLVEPAL